MIKTTMLRLMACPECHGDIEPDNTPEAPGLRCRACSRAFPIVRGVPRFVAALGAMRDVAESFGFQWQQREAGAFESERLYGQSETEEVGHFLRSFGIEDLTSLSGRSILEAGCGSGRLCAALGRSTTALVMGLDISASVEGAARLSATLDNVVIVQGNLFTPPLPLQAFDFVWSEGVIHHTPDAHAAFVQLAAVVKPGGKMFVWLYPKTFHPYRFLRDLLPFTWRLPHWAQLAAYRILGAPLWLAMAVRNAALGKRIHGYREVVFGLHDNLSPRYQSRHTVQELSSWFAEAGFVDIHSVGTGTGVVGERPVRSE